MVRPYDVIRLLMEVDSVGSTSTRRGGRWERGKDGFDGQRYGRQGPSPRRTPMADDVHDDHVHELINSRLPRLRHGRGAVDPLPLAHRRGQAPTEPYATHQGGGAAGACSALLSPQDRQEPVLDPSPEELPRRRASTGGRRELWTSLTPSAAVSPGAAARPGSPPAAVLGLHYATPVQGTGWGPQSRGGSAVGTVGWPQESAVLQSARSAPSERRREP